MYRISWVDFVLVATVPMGLAACLAVIFADINLDLLLVGAGFGFLLSFPVFLLVFIHEQSGEPKRHVRRWYELDNHAADATNGSARLAA